MGPATATKASSQARTRWAFLQQWIKCLQKHLSYVERQELESATLQSGLKYLCVYVPWPPMKTPAYQRKLYKLREAVELVGLMLELDKDAWYLLHKADLVFLEEFDPDDYEACDLTPHFLFTTFSSSNVGGDNLECIAACADLLTGCGQENLSAEFVQAREKILSEMDKRGRLEGFQAPITVVFSPEKLAEELICPYIKQAKTLVTTIQYLSVVGDDAYYPFRLEQVIFRPWKLYIDGNTPSNGSIGSLINCVRERGIRLVEVAVFLEDPDESALGRLLLTTTRPVKNTRGISGDVDTLLVTKTDFASFVNTCSALLTSTSITRLQLYDAFDEGMIVNSSVVSHLCREAKWKWLGFALFSRMSQSTIKELYVDDDRLLASDIQALTSISEASHPLRALCLPDANEDDELSPLNRFVQLSPDARLLLSPFDCHKHSYQNLHIPAEEYFPVIDEETDSEWMEILVPGYGRAMVACESILDVDVRELPSTPRPSTLSSLHLAFNFCDQGAVGTLVQTVGHALVSLHIDAKELHFVSATDVAAILKSCPSLKMLSLNRAKIGSMELFTCAYEQQQCRITTLALCNVEVTNASLCDLAILLTDFKHPMTRTLTEFRYIYGNLEGPSEIPRPDVQGVKLFLEMLASNRVISFFELGLARGLYQKYEPRFRALDAKVVVSHPSDLSMEAKLAFLSCVSADVNGGVKRLRHSPEDMERPRFSQTTLAKIFGFARKRILRVVSATK